MLPYSTGRRIERDSIKPDSRGVEIKRLIGRSLRGALDLSKMQNIFLELDCDVLQADGGTRTAAITGGYIALQIAVGRLFSEGKIHENPLVGQIAAISIGLVNGEILLDLDYSEDSKADVDMNVVMNNNFELIEIQGTGEKTTLKRSELNQMLDISESGITDLFSIQNKYLE